MGGKWQNALPVIAEKDLDKALFNSERRFTRSSLLAKRSAFVLRVDMSYGWQSV